MIPTSRLPGLDGVLGDFARELRGRFGDRLLALRLFGSYARDQAHEDSDVDVAVVLTEADWAARREVLDLAADCGLAREMLLSPTIFDRDTYERWRLQERPLVMDIEREGVPL